MHIMLSSLVHSIISCPIVWQMYSWCRFMDVWTAFISMEVAEQSLDAARGIYKRCYSHVLEDGGQVHLPLTCHLILHGRLGNSAKSPLQPKGT